MQDLYVAEIYKLAYYLFASDSMGLSSFTWIMVIQGHQNCLP